MEIFIDIEYSSLYDQKKYFEKEGLNEIFRPYSIVSSDLNIQSEKKNAEQYCYQKNDVLKIYDTNGELVTNLELQKNFFEEKGLNEIFRPYSIVSSNLKNQSEKKNAEQYLYPPNPYGLVKTLKDTTEQASELVEKLSAEQQSRETNEQLTKLLTDTQRTAIDLVTQLQTEHKKQVVKNTTDSVVTGILKSRVESRVNTETITKPQLTGLLDSTGKEANAVVETLQNYTTTIKGESTYFVKGIIETVQLTGLLDSTETEANTVINTLVKDDALKKSEQLGNQLIKKLKTDEDKQRKQAIVDKFKELIESETKNIVSVLEKAQTVEDVARVADELKKAVQEEFKNKSNIVGAKYCDGELGGCTKQLSDIVQEYKEKVDEEALIIKVDRLEDDIKNTKDKKPKIDQFKQLKTDIESIQPNYTDDTFDYKDLAEYIADIIEANKPDESDVAEPKPEDTLEGLAEEVDNFVKENPPQSDTINEGVSNAAEQLRQRIRQLEDNSGIDKENITKLLFPLRPYYTQFQIFQKRASEFKTKNINDEIQKNCNNARNTYNRMKTFIQDKKNNVEKINQVKGFMIIVNDFIQRCETEEKMKRDEELLQNKETREKQKLEAQAIEAAANLESKKQQFIQKINDILETKPEYIDKPVDALANLTQHIDKKQEEFDALVAEKDILLGQLTVLLEEAKEKQSTGSNEEKKEIAEQIGKLQTKITEKENTIKIRKTELETTKQKKKEIGNSLLIVNVGKSIKKIHDSIMTMTRFIDGFKDSDDNQLRSVLLNQLRLKGHLNKIDPNFLRQFNDDGKIKSQWKYIVDTVLKDLNKTEKKDNLILTADNDTKNIETLREWYISINKDKERLEKEKNRKIRLTAKKTRTLTGLLKTTTETATQIIQELNKKEKERLEQIQFDKERREKQKADAIARQAAEKALKEQEKARQAAEKALKEQEKAQEEAQNAFNNIMEPFDSIKDSVEMIAGGLSQPSIENIIEHTKKYHFNNLNVKGDSTPKWYLIIQSYVKSEKYYFFYLETVFKGDHQTKIKDMSQDKYKYLFGNNNDFFDRIGKVNQDQLNEYLISKKYEIYSKILELKFYNYRTPTSYTIKFVNDNSNDPNDLKPVLDFALDFMNTEVKSTIDLNNISDDAWNELTGYLPMDNSSDNDKDNFIQQLNEGEAKRILLKIREEEKETQEKKDKIKDRETSFKNNYRVLFVFIIYYFGCKMLNDYITGLKEKYNKIYNNDIEALSDLVKHLHRLKNRFTPAVNDFIESTDDLVFNNEPLMRAGKLVKIIECINEIIQIKDNNSEYVDAYHNIQTVLSFDSVMNSNELFQQY